VQKFREAMLTAMPHCAKICVTIFVRTAHELLSF